MSKYGGYGDIHNQAKNRDWQLDYKQKSKGTSGYGQKSQISATTLEEDWKDLKNVFDPRSEEQKIRDKEEKVQKQKEKNAIKSHLYYGNIIKVGNSYIDGKYREIQSDGSIKNKMFSYKNGSVNEQLITKPYKYTVNEDSFTISEHRSLSFPNELKPYMEDTIVTIVPKDQLGKSIDENLAYFSVTYAAKSGKFYSMKVSHAPYVFKNLNSPVLIIVGQELCTIDITSGEYRRLSSIIEKNNGHVEYPEHQEMPDIVELTGDSNSGCVIS